MSNKSKISNKLGLAILATFCSSILLPLTASAKGGATDPIPGTSKSGLNSGGSGGGGGGGGGKSSTTTTTTTTTTTNPQPLVTATLTFTSSASIDGVVPQASGSYRIDPYYPTLSLITVNVSCNSINEADGLPCYVIINTTGGTQYLFTANSFYLLGGAGTVSVQAYCTPGTVITSVDVVDMLGTVLSSGK